MPLNNLIPASAERGAGLILRYRERYLFFLAGSRYRDETSTFYAGIGGHLEAGETWLDCLQREAIEEIGATVTVIDSNRFYHVSAEDQVRRLGERPGEEHLRPLAFLEIPIPADVPWNQTGHTHLYCVLVYRAALETRRLPAPADVDGLLLLPAELVAESLDESLTLGDLLARGAELVEKTPMPRQLRVYPFGTARAMALLMRAGEHF